MYTGQYCRSSNKYVVQSGAGTTLNPVEEAASSILRKQVVRDSLGMMQVLVEVTKKNEELLPSAHS